MDAIMRIADEHHLAVIEDCCHGPGIKLNGRQTGSFGQIACWSMQQSKMFTSAGEGGLATTNDDRLAARLRQIRSHGKAQEPQAGLAAHDFVAPYRVTALGSNYRLSEIQAAFARVQLSKLDGFRARRGIAYEALYAGLREVEGLEFQARQPGVELAYSYFPVVLPRESFPTSIGYIEAALRAEGVITFAIGADELSHVHPLFAEASGRATALAYQLRGDAPLPAYGPGTLPVSEKLAAELLLLPMHPGLSEQDVAEIIHATRKVAQALRAAEPARCRR
jgi:dTDP-4-amino-4,6-dideoxygalactose transaminase